jgi:hypothetical protein
MCALLETLVEQVAKHLHRPHPTLLARLSRLADCFAVMLSAAWRQGQASAAMPFPSQWGDHPVYEKIAKVFEEVNA